MAKPTTSRDHKCLAWDGVSFLVPDNWELGLYNFRRRGLAHIEIEDEYSVRLEADWVRPTHRRQSDRLLSQYEARTKRLSRQADRSDALSPLPAGWSAHVHRFSQTIPKPGGGLQVIKQDMVTALYLDPLTRLTAFFILHFGPEDREDPAATLRLVASELADHSDQTMWPWRLFDISFELPGDFLLENTHFAIGAKLMIFRWRLRRLYLWHFSCADAFLKDTSPPAVSTWLAAYFNDSRLLRGGHFFIAPDGRIGWRRLRRHLLAHRDQLARWCFKYETRFRLDPERNQLIAWVFNHRHADDLDAIPGPLRFQ